VKECLLVDKTLSEAVQEISLKKVTKLRDYSLNYSTV
jgi:hypothetical protein